MQKAYKKLVFIFIVPLFSPRNIQDKIYPYCNN